MPRVEEVRLPDQSYWYLKSLTWVLPCLTEASVKQGSTQVNDFKYQYDWSGNLTSSTLGIGATPSTYSYNAANELTSSVHGSTTTTYNYDADGNLSGWSSGGLSFSYN